MLLSAGLAQAKEALSRGCSFGQCLLFLPRSLSPYPQSFSLARCPALVPPPPPFTSASFLSTSPRALSPSFRPSLPRARVPRSLSSLDPHQAAHSRAASRIHETRVPCEIPLSSCERPSAARIIPRDRARSRKICPSVAPIRDSSSRLSRYIHLLLRRGELYSRRDISARGSA